MSTTATERRATIPAGTWTLDPVHSAVTFRVVDATQFFATVNGRFEEFEGTIEAGDTIEDLKIRGRIQADSITTHQEQRDAHLKSPDFLNVSSNPEIFRPDRGRRRRRRDGDQGGVRRTCGYSGSPAA